MDIGDLLKQHADIVDQMGILRALLDLPNSAPLAVDVGRRLDVLAATVALYLSFEDREVYPALLASPTEKNRDIAERLFVEMGHLRRAFLNYREKWKSDRDIQSRFRAFVEETQQVFSLVEARIQKENKELIPLWANKDLGSPSLVSPRGANPAGTTETTDLAGKNFDPFAQVDISVLRQRGKRNVSPGRSAASSR
ncbi:MAG: hemerythrin domain-containing protein [Elusimicrobia bacterium]|nr:hemerythrin domain-containing protein [Elusimicrobiota bacterium]MBP9127370.1 hemerythrin domain-containing protein [Elusimicrobiota bacterium]